MAGRTDFGAGTTEFKHKDGRTERVACHSWPLHLFKRHFQDFKPDATDDWKAAVYTFGGPRPSLIEKTDIQVNLADGCIELCYWLKPGVRGEYHQFDWGWGVRWLTGEGDGIQQEPR